MRQSILFTTFTLTIIILLFSNCSPLCSKNKGIIVSEELDLGAFHSVVNHSAARLHISEGASQSVRITGNTKLIDKISFLVAQNELEIEMGSSIIFCDYDQVNIEIVIPKLQRLETTGNANSSISNFSNIENIKLVCSGNGNIKLSNTNITNCILSISGNGNFDAFHANIKRLEANISGNGNGEVNVTEKLSLNVSGNGNFYYKGHPEIDLNMDGNGKIVDINQ